MATSYEETEAVRAIVANVPHHIDGKQWIELQSLYANEVASDYTSLFGGEPQKQPAEALIEGWRGALSRVATQHLLGPINVRVDAATATASCHVRALHFATDAPGGEQWEVLGHYLFELSRGQSGWKITRMKLETFLQTGNLQLLAEVSIRSR